MEVFLFILKTAGIILLIILGLFLAFAALLLFVPVRYRAEGSLPEEGRPKAYIRFTWLLRLVSFRAEYAEGLHMTVRVAGIRVRPEKWKKSGPPKTAGSQVPREPVPAGSGPVSSGPGPVPADSGPVSPGSGPVSPEPGPASSGSLPVSGAEESQNGLGKKGLVLLKNKLSGLLRGLRDGKRTLEGFMDRGKRIWTAAARYLRILTEEESQRLLRMIWEQGKKLLFHLMPKKISADLTVGAGDPAVTGNVLAVHGILYPWIGDTVHIVPDFDEERLCGEFCMSGRIRACTVLYHILRVVLDKRTWIFIRRLKKEELTNG
ncbi:MAG TPA: DUF2953 domain-containing protein [Candidatus Eisenbergiella merdipullorum]|uniref:DUF2953 domain-containing protein n=1 Tax=Candidatus Eisenbergiella merdipullorum TaxID=2838553 RepID=A0A9D2I8P1_9FIRM|nr:DUF2953 domain-containing protein [Candidatus Eisenbergiella merdipullorum]